MITETKGVVLRQTKTAGGRKMILLFTEQFGKIGAGTFAEESNRRRPGLALRPFSLGRYELRRSGDYWHINRGEVIRDHYGLGDNVEKYMAACYALELIDKLVPDEGRLPELFHLLAEYLDLLEARKSHYGLLPTAFTVQALRLVGQEPLLTACVNCGRNDRLTALAATAGGAVCADCRQTVVNERLIYAEGFDIVNILKFMADQPLSKLSGLTVQATALAQIQGYLRAHLSAHLDINGLKSDINQCDI